jgi:archaellum component FlaC
MSQPSQEERAAFEAWAADYWQNSMPPHNAWTGWKARAALSASPGAMPVAWQWRYRHVNDAAIWSEWGEHSPALASYSDYIEEKRPLFAHSAPALTGDVGEMPRFHADQIMHSLDGYQPVPNDAGTWVRYSDAAAALTAQAAKLTRLSSLFDAAGNYIPHSQVEGDLREARVELEQVKRDLNAAKDEIDDLEANSEKVAAEFEGDCWKAMRSLLNECHFDWGYADPEGVSAEDAREHISTTLAEFEKTEKHLRSKAEAAEAEVSRLTRELNQAKDQIDREIRAAAALRASALLEPTPSGEPK